VIANPQFIERARQRSLPEPVAPNRNVRFIAMRQRHDLHRRDRPLPAVDKEA
jgi:hypothetical protein